MSSSFSVPRQLLAARKARLPQTHKYFVACFYNKPPPKKVAWDDISRSTLEERCGELIGKPVDVDHWFLRDGIGAPVGTVDDCIIDPNDGSAWAIFHIDDPDARQKVENGKYRMVSLSHNTKSGDFLGLAVTDQAHRENTWIVHCSGYVNQTNPSIQPLSASHFAYWYNGPDTFHRSVALASLFRMAETAAAATDTPMAETAAAASAPPPPAAPPSSISLPVPTSKRNAVDKSVLSLLSELRKLNLHKERFKRNTLSAAEKQKAFRVFEILKDYSSANGTTTTAEDEEEDDDDEEGMSPSELDNLRRNIQSLVSQKPAAADAAPPPPAVAVPPQQDPAYVEALVDKIMNRLDNLPQMSRARSDTTTVVTDSKGNVISSDAQDVKLEEDPPKEASTAPPPASSRKRKEVPPTSRADQEDDVEEDQKEPQAKKQLSFEDVSSFLETCDTQEVVSSVDAAAVSTDLSEKLIAALDRAEKAEAERDRIKQAGISALRETKQGAQPPSYAQKGLGLLGKHKQRIEALYKERTVPLLARQQQQQQLLPRMVDSHASARTSRSDFIFEGDEQLWKLASKETSIMCRPVAYHGGQMDELVLPPEKRR